MIMAKIKIGYGNEGMLPQEFGNSDFYVSINGSESYYRTAAEAMKFARNQCENNGWNPDKDIYVTNLARNMGVMFG